MAFGGRKSALYGYFTDKFGGWTDQKKWPRLLGDVNGDGRDDVVAFDSNDVWVALAAEPSNGGQSPELNNPYKALTTAFTVNDGGWDDDNRRPRRVADVNGDGRADIVGFDTDQVLVSLGQSDGTFAAPKTALTTNFTVNDNNWSNDNRWPRRVADVNGDGRADIVGFDTDQVVVSLGQSDGTFAASKSALTTAFTVDDGRWRDDNRWPRHVADVNGDGRADIVGFDTDQVLVSLGQSDGTFAAPKSALTTAFTVDDGGWSDDNKWPRRVADVDGDGRADIVGIHNDKLSLSLGKADGTFHEPTVVSSSSSFSYNQGWRDNNRNPILMGDMDGDGAADIVGFRGDNVWVSRGPASAIPVVIVIDAVAPQDIESEFPNVTPVTPTAFDGFREAKYLTETGLLDSLKEYGKLKDQLLAADRAGTSLSISVVKEMSKFTRYNKKMYREKVEKEIAALKQITGSGNTFQGKRLNLLKAEIKASELNHKKFESILGVVSLKDAPSKDTDLGKAQAVLSGLGSLWEIATDEVIDRTAASKNTKNPFVKGAKTLKGSDFKSKVSKGGIAKGVSIAADSLSLADSIRTGEKNGWSDSQIIQTTAKTVALTTSLVSLLPAAAPAVIAGLVIEYSLLVAADVVKAENTEEAIVMGLLRGTALGLIGFDRDLIFGDTVTQQKASGWRTALNIPLIGSILNAIPSTNRTATYNNVVSNLEKSFLELAKKDGMKFWDVTFGYDSEPLYKLSQRRISQSTHTAPGVTDSGRKLIALVNTHKDYATRTGGDKADLIYIQNNSSVSVNAAGGDDYFMGSTAFPESFTDIYTNTNDDPIPVYDGNAGRDTIAFSGITTPGKTKKRVEYETVTDTKLEVDLTKAGRNVTLTRWTTQEAAPEKAGGTRPVGSVEPSQPSGRYTTGFRIQNIETIVGSDFADTLISNNDDHTLVGGQGNDTLTGNGGDDVLLGGEGRNTLSGGDGDDALLSLSGTIDGGAGWDTLLVSADQDAADTLFDAGQVTLQNVEALIGTDRANIILLDDVNLNMSIDLKQGQDFVVANNADQVIDAGTNLSAVLAMGGNDDIYFGLGNHLIDGGDGYDQVVMKQDADGYVQLHDRALGLKGRTLFEGYRSRLSNDVLSKHGQTRTTDGSTYRDGPRITGHANVFEPTLNTGILTTTLYQVESFKGNEKDNRISVSSNTLATNQTGVFISGGGGDDLINGGRQKDRLMGSDGNDTISGGLGDDILIGGTGNDLLKPGGGTDTILFARGDGQDVLEDFNPEQDVVKFEGGIDYRLLDFDRAGSDLVIKILGTNDQLTIKDGLYRAPGVKTEPIIRTDTHQVKLGSIGGGTSLANPSLGLNGSHWSRNDEGYITMSQETVQKIDQYWQSL